MTSFVFSFDHWIWANQRRSVRNTGVSGWWYKILWTLLKPQFEKRTQQAEYIYSQLDIDKCPEDKLYLWGQRLSLPQKTAESYQDWRYRLKNKWYRKEGISLAQKLRIIADMSGIDITMLKWFKIHPYVYKVGDPVGSRVSSRDYALNAYRIYAADNGTTNWQQVADEVGKIEKGAQLLEIWVQKAGSPQRGILPDDPVTTPENEYDIY